MVRKPRNLILTVLSLAGSLLAVNAFISGIRRVSLIRRPAWMGKMMLSSARITGMENPLVSDSIRAFVMFYVVYMLSSYMGYMQFKEDVTNQSILPRVTAVMHGDQATPLACGKQTNVPPDFIGDAKLVRNIQDYYRTCTSPKSGWRLLYRDDKSVYLFASTEENGRPLTIVIPNEKTNLVME